MRWSKLRWLLPVVAVLTGCGGGVRGTTSPAVDPNPGISDAAAFDAVQCPSTHLCVAIDRSGDVVTSSGPSATDWKLERLIKRPVGHLSCPSARLCVLESARSVFASSNPARGVGTWHHVYHDDLSALSCPSVSLCRPLRQCDLLDKPGEPSHLEQAAHVEQAERRSGRRSHVPEHRLLRLARE